MLDSWLCQEFLSPSPPRQDSPPERIPSNQSLVSPGSGPPRQDTPPSRIPSHQSVVSPGTDLEASLDQAVDQAGGVQRPAAQVARAHEVKTAVGQAEDSQAMPSTIHKPVAEKDGIAEQTKHPQETVSARAAIDRLNAALDKRRETKEKTSDEKTPSSKKKANMKKPASSKAAPKAAPKSKVKPSTLKRPASSQASSSDFSKGKVSRKESFKLMPTGCTSCRFVAGCTRSCWKKRKYEPLW